MRRGDICVVAGGKDYAGKPRPAVFRLPVEPNARNGPGPSSERLGHRAIIQAI